MQTLTLLSFVKGKCYYVLSILCLLLAGISYGQQPPTGSYPDGLSTKIIPPSPEAASLGKYGFWPVSNYTGIPNISIPLYAINAGGYSLPVSLNYHAGGVKIDEKSSWVGINWTLFAGGAITVTVVGKPDALTSEKTFKDIYNLSGGLDYNFMANSLREGGADTEQDIYSFSFGGFSGKFFLDGDFNVHTIPVSNLNFLKTPFSSTHQPGDAMWVIADEKGNQYFFAQNSIGIEMTRSYKGSIGGSATTTAYYLTQIVLANKVDTINFNYTAKDETYAVPYSQSLRTVGVDLVQSHVGDPNATFVYDCNGTLTYSERYKTNRVLYNGAELQDRVSNSLYNFGQTQLESITWRGGKVSFKANTIRQDMLYNTAKLLDSIVVSDRNDQRIKAVCLKRSYVNGRYFLDSLIETGTDPQNVSKHTFCYFNKAFLPPTEPLKDQTTTLNPYAQDHWGYFNGATANTNLLPSNPGMPALANTYLTSNREPDSLTMQYGVLNKIIYPTGGYTQLNYEPNRYKFDAVLNPGGPTSSIIPKSAGVQMNMFMPVKNTSTFTVEFDQANVNITVSFNDYNHPPTKRLTVYSYARLEKKLPDGSYQQVRYWDSFDDFPTTSISPNPRGYYDFQIQQTLSLLAGEYRLEVNDACYNGLVPGGDVGACLAAQYPNQEEDYWLIPRVGMSLSYQGYAPQQQSEPKLPFAGGLRIKRMANFDGVRSLPVTKEFEYGQGNLMKYPSRYLNIYESFAGVLNNCYSDAALMEVTSTSQVIPGFTQGSIVGYDTVIERDIAGGVDNGYISYRYSFTPDSLNALYFNAAYWTSINQAAGINFSYDAVDPTFPSNSFDYKNGLLLTRSVYKSGLPGPPVLLDSVVNTYNLNDYNAQKGYFRRRSLRAKQLNFYTDGRTYGENLVTPVYDDRSFSYSFYDNITSWVQLASTKEIKYDQTGANPLTTVTDYEYNDKNLLANKITTTDSKGEKNINRISFAVDYTLTGTPTDDIAKGIKTLQDNYVIAAPVEQRIQKSNNDGSNVRTLSSTLFTYKITTPLPDVIYKTRNASPMTDFVTVSINASATVKDTRYDAVGAFNQYDIYGNIREQQKTGDIKEVYLWGYQGQYPVAKVIGSDLATVILNINQSVLDNPSSDAALRSHLNSLRSIPGAIVTTYTYKPLVGMTSATDPTGKTVFYEYDDLGRLKRIRDKDNNILKTFDYKYKEQQ